MRTMKKNGDASVSRQRMSEREEQEMRYGGQKGVNHVYRTVALAHDRDAKHLASDNRERSLMAGASLPQNTV